MTVSAAPTPQQDLRDAELAVREARWWYLQPGDDGFDQPLHAYLGFTERQWRARVLGVPE